MTKHIGTPTRKEWLAALGNTHDEADDEDTGRRVTHYDPQIELIGQRAELARLRDVEQLAREMARIIGFELDIIRSPMDTPYARDVMERARELGLLSE